MISKVHPSITRTQKIASKFEKKLAQQTAPIDFSGLGNNRKALETNDPADLLRQLQASLSNIQSTNGGAFNAASLNPNVVYSAATIVKTLKSLKLDEKQSSTLNAIEDKLIKTLPDTANSYFKDVLSGKVVETPKEGFSLATYKSDVPNHSELAKTAPNSAKSAPTAAVGGKVDHSAAMNEIQMAENVLRSLSTELKSLTDAGNFTAKTKRLYQLDVYRLRPMAELYKKVENDTSMADVKTRLTKFFGEQFTSAIDDHDRQTLYNADPELLDVMGKVSGRTASNRINKLTVLANKIDKKY